MIKAENSSKIPKNPRNFPEKSLKTCHRAVLKKLSQGGILAIPPCPPLVNIFVNFLYLQLLIMQLN